MIRRKSIYLPLQSLADSMESFTRLVGNTVVQLYEIKHAMENPDGGFGLYDFTKIPDPYKTETPENLLEERLFRILDSFWAQVGLFVKRATKDQRIAFKEYVRSSLDNFTVESALGARALLRPLGYQGDFEQMRMVYNNSYEGYTSFGKVLHKYFVSTPHAQAVRNRVTMVPALMPSGITNALSLACGPAFEIGNVLSSNPGARITLLDHDKHALAAARHEVAKTHKDANVHYVQESVINIIKHPETCNAWKGDAPFDCIWSMGLFDYLNDSQAAQLVSILLDMLAPGGILIIGNYHVDDADRWGLMFCLDWPLCYRTEQDMLNMVPAEYRSNSAVVFEDTKTQMFLTVKKKKLQRSML